MAHRLNAGYVRSATLCGRYECCWVIGLKTGPLFPGRATEKTTFADAFAMADQVLSSGSRLHRPT